MEQEAMTASKSPRSAGRQSGRAGRRKPAARTPGIAQPAWHQPQRPYAPLEIISQDQLEALHHTSLKILSQVGLRILCPLARQSLKNQGAEVDDNKELVTLAPELVEQLVAQAPDQARLHARNPDKHLTLGGNHAIFSSVGGPAFVSDLDKGRRPGTYAELCDYLRVIQSLDILHQEGGGSFEPLDLPLESRHLDLHYAQATLTDKNWQPLGLGQHRARDGLEMAALSLGCQLDDLIEKPVFTCIINTNSPLTIDQAMAEGLMEMARYGQPVVITPFTLSGAMSPVTLAGALAQQNAEALGGIALAQSVRPGTPVVYGAFTTNVDMKTGSPAFGTPEYTQAAQISGQLARRYGLPLRSSNVTAANAVDAQAAYESQMALWGALMGGTHLLNHAAGWMEGGLTASFEKLIIDAEMLQMMAAYFQPPQIDDASLAFDTICDVGHGGHFFGTDHTLARYQTAFYKPLVSDWDNFENWRDKGSVDTAQRANKLWKQLLKDYQQPPLDPAIDESLQAFVAKRKEEISAGINVPRT
ncbi:trimethylamine methyltransferase family protein [Rhodovibrionaceae bacterium A322]